MDTFHAPTFRGLPRSRLDLTPILNQCKHAPNLTLRRGLNHRFESTVQPWLSAKHPLDALFDIYNRPRLAEYLSEAVEHVFFDYGLSLEFCVHQERYEAWMNQFSQYSVSSVNNFGIAEYNNWCAKLGFHGAHSLGAVGFCEVNKAAGKDAMDIMRKANAVHNQNMRDMDAQTAGRSRLMTRTRALALCAVAGSLLWSFQYIWG